MALEVSRASPRPGRYRQLPHGRATGRRGRIAVVVLSALRFRSGVLTPGGRRRGEGLLRRRRWRGRSPARRPTCATPRSCRPSCAMTRGNALRITDFTPRFKRFERVFNPPQIFRRIEPLAGLPRIRIRVRPTFNYGGPVLSRALGSNHIRYSGGADTLRADHRCGPLLHRPRDAVRAHQAGHAHSGAGRAVRSRGRHRPRASFWSARATTGSTGCARWPCRSNSRPRSSARPSR